MSAYLALFGVGLLAVALFAGYRGLRWVARYVSLTRADPGATGDVHSPGSVAVSGTVRSESVFESPVRGEDCVLATWEIEEWTETHHGKRWRTVDENVYAAPFELDDGSGPVTVDLREHDGDRVTVGGGDWLGDAGPVDPDVVPFLDDVEPVETLEHGDPSGRLGDLETAAGLGEQSKGLVPELDFGRQQGERRFSEHVVAPGDELFVHGGAHVDPDASRPPEPEDVTIRPPGRDPVVDLDFPWDLALRLPTRDAVLVSEAGVAETTAEVRNRTLLAPGAMVLGALGAGAVVAPSLFPSVGTVPLVFGGVFVLAFGFVLYRPPSEW